MTSSRALARNLALACAFFAVTAAGLPAVAEAGMSKKEAMAVCRKKYGKEITDVVIQKNGQIVCQEGPGKNASRKEVYDYCKRTLKANMIIMVKKYGRWHCRYSGPY